MYIWRQRAIKVKCIFMQSTSSFQRGLSNPRKKFLSGSHLLVNIFAMPVRNPSHTSPLLCKLYSIHAYGVWRKTPAVCYLRPLTWERKNKQTNKTFSPIRAVFLPFGYFKTGRNDDATAERTGFILRSKPPHLRSMKTRNIFSWLKNKKVF